MKTIKTLFYILAVSLLYGIIIPLSFGEDSIVSYSALISQKIVGGMRAVRFPQTVVPRGRIRTVLNMSILPDGKIYLVKIAESSGIEEFDQEAKNFVKELAPYPPLPEGRHTPLEIRVPIEAVGEENLEQKAKAAAAPEINKPKPADFVQTVPKVKDAEKIAEKKIVVPSQEKPAVEDARIEPEAGKFSAEKSKIAPIAQEAESFYQVALKNSDPAEVARQQLGLAQLKVKESWRNLFPKMDMQYSVSEGETITDPYKSEAYALQLRQNIFDKGKTWKTLRKEKLNLEVTEKEYEKTVQELKFEVARSYLNVVGKQEELAVVIAFKDEVRRDYDLADTIYQAGAISKVEFVDIEAEYQRTINMLSQINNELQLAKEKLRASMNLSPYDEVPFKELELPRLGEVDIDVEVCISLALKNKPEVRLWEISLEAAEYARDIADSENTPRLDLVSSYGASGEAYSTQTLDLAEEWKLMGVVTWLFGGSSLEFSGVEERVSDQDVVTELARKVSSNTYSAKLSVLDKWQYYVQKKEAQIAYTQNLSNLSRNKQEVVFDTRKSFLEYKQSFDEYDVALFEDRSSAINLELKKEAFKVGRGNLSEVVKARADYIRRRLSLVRAKTSYFISLLGVDMATAFSLGIF